MGVWLDHDGGSVFPQLRRDVANVLFVKIVVMAKLQMYIEFKTFDEGWQAEAFEAEVVDNETQEIGDTETQLLAAVERDLLRMISEHE